MKDNIEVQILVNLSDLLVSHQLEHNDIINISIGNDNQIYVLLAKEAPKRINGKFVPAEAKTEWYTLIINVDWQTKELNYCQKINFEKQNINFHFIQPINDHYLLLGARSKQHKNGDFDKNAVIVDENGNLYNSFCLGDGIMQCIVDDTNFIITSYFDEGIFGGFDNPVGKNGLVRWSSDGNKVWENERYDILDCYAINIDTNNNLWFYFYNDFSLVKTDYKNYQQFTPQIYGSSAFLLARDLVSILFQGGYKDSNFYLVKKTGLKLTCPKKCEFINSNGKSVNIYKVKFRKSMALLLDNDNNLYCKD